MHTRTHELHTKTLHNAQHTHNAHNPRKAHTDNTQHAIRHFQHGTPNAQHDARNTRKHRARNTCKEHGRHTIHATRTDVARASTTYNNAHGAHTHYIQHAQLTQRTVRTTHTMDTTCANDICPTQASNI
eukprot:762599-Alexandrium_andersonii.AAC.1